MNDPESAPPPLPTNFTVRIDHSHYKLGGISPVAEVVCILRNLADSLEGEGSLDAYATRKTQVYRFELKNGRGEIVATDSICAHLRHHR